MPSPYQVFAQKAKERFEKKRQTLALGKGGYRFTLHSQYKMRQYGLSEQRVRSVIRSPKRREVGIVPRTVAVMQPVSPKKIVGKPARPGEPGRSGGEVWKQEIWVLFQIKNKNENIKNADQKSKLEKFKSPLSFGGSQLVIISAWRYPGVSPKRNPIPDEILRELEDGSILEAEDDVSFQSYSKS
ncbi:MAG: hypothetical protein AAB547_03820 [Patescibacteria group bacterium]